MLSTAMPAVATDRSLTVTSYAMPVAEWNRVLARLIDLVLALGVVVALLMGSAYLAIRARRARRAK